jgi:hypothetical protein
MPQPRPPLALSAEVITANGARFPFGAHLEPDRRLTGLSFGTKLGEGFSDASATIARRVDRDYPDIGLVDTWAFVGADGETAYEGRLSANPRELTDHHAINVTLTGWMAHAKDRKFREVYVDRAFSSWGPPARRRRINLATLNYTNHDPAAYADPSLAEAGISLKVGPGGWASPYKPVSESWYFAPPGVQLGLVEGWWKRETTTTLGGADPVWKWHLYLSNDDIGSVTAVTANLQGVGPGTATIGPATTFTATSAFAQLYYDATPVALDGAEWALAWYKLAVYGNHGLTWYTGLPDEPAGVMLSDVIKNIAARWCPQLDTRGVLPNSYVLQHCAFRDRTYPYDAFLELNAAALWHLAVWEDRVLHFRPYDFTTAKWQVRTDEQGVSVNLQGDSIDDLHNGICVTYQDVLSGAGMEVTPDDDEALRDPDPGNPWNAHGIAHWDELDLSRPMLRAEAVGIGAMVLRDRNRPRAPGTITVKGYCRDAQGNPQQGWKVRAGDTIAITDFPNDTPRLIVETRWNDDDKTMTIGVDQPLAVTEAIEERIMSALEATQVRT